MEISELLRQLVRAFLDFDGPGGYFVLIILFLACTIYFVLTRWIIAGGKDSANRTSHD